MPWYGKLRQYVAPTETAANISLVVIAAMCLLLLWKGDAVMKAAFVIYMFSP